MSADIRTVGDRIRTMRDRVGMSQTQVAAASGLHLRTVCAVERGEAGEVRLATLTAIAAALDVPVGVLLGERPPPVHWPVDGVFWRQVRREVEQIQGVTP